MKCPVCDGGGGWPDDRGIDGYEDWDDCGYCSAVGTISLRHYLSYWFWQYLPQRPWEWYVEWRYDDRDFGRYAPTTEREE